MLVEECGNAPDSMRQVSVSYSPSLPCHLLACCILPCHHLHFICMFFKTCIRSGSPGSLLLHSESRPLARAPSPLSDLVLCAGVKHSRNRPRFAKRPWYSTGRPPVKFRAIWRSFVTPTVNRVARNPPFSLQPNTPSKWPKTQQTPLHALGRSITIAWPKTAPHLDSPSSLYL